MRIIMRRQRWAGFRMSEIRDLRWEYVKNDCIELPDAKTGGRVVLLVPGMSIVRKELGLPEAECVAADEAIRCCIQS